MIYMLNYFLYKLMKHHLNKWMGHWELGLHPLYKNNVEKLHAPLVS